jgi:hypothetical protein
MTDAAHKHAAFTAAFLCLLFVVLPNCAVLDESLERPFSAKKGTYKVNIVVVDNVDLKRYGRYAYYYKEHATIVLPSRNTLECAAHEVGHALGWEHKKPSYQYCRNWGLE